MTSPKSLLNDYQLVPRKRLGQNFLCDPQMAEAIVQRSRLRPAETVIEIGAGTGALTIPAARLAKRVHAIETDGRLTEILEKNIRLHELDNVIVSHADFMEIDIEAIFREAGGLLAVIGNLPYYLSSQMLVRLISCRHFIDRAVLMFQKELAERLTAPPGGKDYGRLSVMLRFCARIEPLLKARRQLFFPRPEVDSQVIKVTFVQPEAVAVCPDDLLFSIIRTAFARRRKTLKNALATGLPQLPPDRWADILSRSGISPDQRAEALDAPDYVDICINYQAEVENPSS